MKGHLSQYARVYGLLLCITIFESTCIKFFPWLVSDFSKYSGGYPTPMLFRLCGYGKIVQSFVSTIVQIIVLKYSSSTSYCGIIIITAISSSIIVLVMTLFEIIFQSNSLATNAGSKGSTNDNSTSNNGNVVDACRISDIEISNAHRISIVTTNSNSNASNTSTVTTNPLLSPLLSPQVNKGDTTTRLTI